MEKVTFLYKSGQKVHVEVHELTVTWATDGNRVTKLEWTRIKPEPIMAGINNIEAVWNGHV